MSGNIFADDEEEFRDIPDEVTEGQSAPPVNVRTARPATPPPAPQPTIIQEYEENPELDTSLEEDDFGDAVTDARFRLELGRLYEMLLNHDIFAGAEADEKAVKAVTKQIRNFAKEQMEIMLGMRQEVAKVEPLAAADFPFNDLEVQILKALASTASKGATAAPEVQVFSGAQAAVAPRKTGLNPISVKPTQKPVAKPAPKPLAQKPAAPVTRKQERTEAQIEQILAEEGITREEYERQYNPNYKPLTKPLSNMSEAEIKEWRRQDALKTNKQVKNPTALPMPTPEQEEMLHTQRAQAAASHPQMQSIMSLLLTAKK